MQPNAALSTLAVASLCCAVATAAETPVASLPPSDAAPAPSAQPAPAAPESAAGAPSPPKPKQAPYSLPWQLRPAAVGNVVRSDTAVALYKDPSTSASGSTIATTLLASYKVADAIAPLVRVGVVRNSPPAGDAATAFLNPVLGGTYLAKLGPELRLAAFLGLALPLGSGGGNSPDKAVTAARGAGILARSAMDNAMFAVNDFTVFPGIGLAYVAGGLTAQVEATVLQLTRVKGADVQKDERKTNLTSGVHLGYFVFPEISIGAELRHQRWLSTPVAVETNPAARDTTTVAAGPRAHLKIGESLWIRPGVAYATGLDKPMTDAKYHIVQIDVPVAF